MHVVTRLVAGGAQRNTLICASHQQKSGNDVLVVSGTEAGSEGSLLDEASSASYRWAALPELVRKVNPALDALALIKLVRLLRSEQPDVVHTHTSKGGILGRLAATLCQVPVVVHTPHGHVFHSYFSRWKATVFQWLERFAAPLADALVMLSSEELADHHRAQASSAGSVVVIPSGVDVSQFASLNCQGNPFTVGYVGRLADIKGPLDLVEAFALHTKQCPRSRLLIVGDGPMRKEVEDLVQYHQIQNQVEMVGWQPDVRDYLQRMSLLVVPSHNEGMGRVVVEAMAAGLTVVATRVGGLLDLVQPGLNGILVSPRQPDELAEALNQCAADPSALLKMGAQGRKRARDFSQELMLSRLDLLYTRLIRMKAAGL